MRRSSILLPLLCGCFGPRATGIETMLRQVLYCSYSQLPSDTRVLVVSVEKDATLCFSNVGFT